MKIFRKKYLGAVDVLLTVARGNNLSCNKARGGSIAKCYVDDEQRGCSLDCSSVVSWIKRQQSLIFLLIFSINLTACQSLKDVFQQSDYDRIQQQAFKEKQELDSVEKLFYQKKYLTAEKSYSEFLKNYPQSQYRIVALGGLAQSLEAQQSLEKLTKAESVYTEVQELSIAQNNLEAWANSSYQLSLIQESKGETMKALTSLKSLELRENQLPEVVGMLQVPARMAMIYFKLNEKKLGEDYRLKAQKNLDLLIRSRETSLNSSWLARIYFEIGYMRSEDLNSISDLEAKIKLLRSAQVYLLRALDCDDPYWQERSQDSLTQNYRQIWQKIQKEKSIEMARLFSTVLVELEVTKTLPDLGMNRFQIKVYEEIKSIKGELDNFLFDNQASLPLTQDSESANGVRRPGKTQVNELLPEEKKKTKKTKSKKDPNL